ncbi:sugar transferase [Aureimonas endophytica]|uniref:Sugar transferase n=1 Tax=Aureimonas endophytica TaxID=2027858 RepID=A0A916ZJ59_9HYPH|nr:sugar transferase [Aureimonas endophytica]GGE00782.1 sugar transferase [Aureimonas endophytica]
MSLALKRLLDIVASLFGLLVLGWLVLLFAWMIRRETPGPGIFRQERVGRNRVPFTCLKLRTMAAGTVSAATHDTPASAVTPLGEKLRRTKLDELPQLWNVLKGEMSLVGPRPSLPIQTELVAARSRRGVFALRPGITGLAQIEGVDMSTPERLAERDAHYLATRSFLGDLRIILATVFGAGQGDHVA